MSRLDINTELGQVSLAKEKEMISIFNLNYPDTSYIHTNKTGTAGCDGFLVKNGELLGIAETKCRFDLSIEKFANTFDYNWLVTFEKILKCRRMAEDLDTTFYGFLYLVVPKLLLFKKLWSPNGGWNTSMEITKTRTKATINGGQVWRDNAYIDMSDSAVLTGKQK